MELSQETTTALYKNTIQYLYNITENVPNTLNVLKSYYASKFTISQLQTKINLEGNKSKYDARCRKCCLKLRQTGASCVVSSETKQSKFAHKVLKKVNANKRLTKFQKKYLKKNNLRPGNRLVVTCSFCKKEATRILSKPVKVRINVNANQPSNGQNKKKKKKKDKFCGLQKEAVVSAKHGNSLNGVNVNNKQNGSGVSHESQSRVLNNPICKQRENNKKKKNLKKLNTMLKQNSNFKAPKNNLAQFLQSVAK